ncbi:MAG TPA: transketolase C-terminal domain-containing protein, partial [Usitatibacter sp.]|nr:transketolase C-terminal domain-containing protein [Usitatibacter sp.]
VFYYVTIMNESYAQPGMPEGAREGILRGMYKARQARREGPRVRLLGAGTILQEALAAAEVLESEFGIGADVFSVTSFTELRRDGMEVSRARRHSREGGNPICWIESQLPATGAPVIAASDYVSSVADLIRPWIADAYVALGTDGFGRSDTRASLRRFFEVDRHSIVVAALSALGDARAAETAKRFDAGHSRAAPWTR